MICLLLRVTFYFQITLQTEKLDVEIFVCVEKQRCETYNHSERAKFIGSYFYLFDQ